MQRRLGNLFNRNQRNHNDPPGQGPHAEPGRAAAVNDPTVQPDTAVVHVVRPVPNREIALQQRMLQLRDLRIGDEPAHAPFARPAMQDAPTLRANVGLSPQNFAECERLLVEGLDSARGLFQFVSRKAHAVSIDPTKAKTQERSIIDQLLDEWQQCGKEPGKKLQLAGRYEVTQVEQQPPQAKHRRVMLTVRDLEDSSKTITVPLTQAGLKFTDRLLRWPEIQTANTLLEEHRQYVEHRAPEGTMPTADPMIISLMGNGRNAVLITYRKTLDRINAEPSTSHLDEHWLNNTLNDIVMAGRRERGPEFIHSQAQLQELRAGFRAVLEQRNQSSQAEATSERPASPFSQLNFDEKIQSLLDAADELKNQAEGYDANFLDVVTKEVGSRNLTAKECLGFALEVALENRRQQVPDISLRIINILNPNDQGVRLFGVDFSKERIEAWSKEESLPEPIQVRQEFIDKDAEFGQRHGEDVHNRPVVRAGDKSLQVMRNRTLAGSKKTADETDVEIRRYIATQPPSELVMAGLNRIMERDGEGRFDGHLSSALATVWGYIEQGTNQEMKQNLRNASLAKLEEIGREWPCRPGVYQRIADIPNGIDLSLPQDIQDEEVFTELAKMAGDINASFEDDHAFNCSGAREEAGPDEDSPARMAVEATISDLKRDMFLAKARVELVLLRNIDANFVMTTAERVFPKGMVI